MHGTVQREGESSRNLQRSISQHMRSVTPLTTSNRTIAAAGDNPSVTSSTTTTTSTASDSFFKDGRKISIGDCALFKPPQDSPPFIGIIRWLAVSKEKKLQLGVNWLYRPAELKLGKGIQLDAAPNEIFYSFHKDEIPAASLLHPCKVSFLPKGVELRAGVSSFICRRVYDIENNCLWWLNDQDYINERQEEVDQLLHKTRREMHANMQSGGPSPKPVNSPASTLHSKSGPDNGQIGATSFSPQVKGKKRERGDQGVDPIKKERSSKTDDGDSGILRAENSLKSEIVKITGKGGLIELEGVEKFIQLMQPERMDKKVDLINRSLLAGVLAATDKFDCLNRFVQLKGLPVLDEWLQDIHKGKINDGNSSKDGDKSVEEFLLVLLRALDKLPVNLHALQMCNIGKSVNNLRSHKNLEIQKKARSLVDTWKKRVEAEIDSKSSSTQAVSPWPSKSRLPEPSQGGSKNSNCSDVAIKSSITLLSASKTSSVKFSHGESNMKTSSSSPSPIKSSPPPATGKDIQPPRNSIGNASDLPLSREDKSSSAVQSHSYSESLVKDDLKASASGLVSVNKISGSASRHRKSSNGFPGTPVTGVLKETSSSRSSSLHRSTALEKSSHSALNIDKALQAPVSEGSSHKLIVKIPNRGRVPAQGANTGSSEDPTIMSSRVSSPAHSEKNDQIDHKLKERSDEDPSIFTSDVNIESWQGNDSKDVMNGSDEAVGSRATLRHQEQSTTTEASRRIIDASKRNDLRLSEASFSPMNAFIESCVKYSEANSYVSLEDDIGMNLLASVAAGEMSRIDSPERSTHVADEVCPHENGKSKSSPEDGIAGGQILCSDHGDSKNQVISGTSFSEDGSPLSKHALLEYSGERRCASSQVNEDSPTGECNKHVNLACMDLRNGADPQGDINEKSSEMKSSASLMASGTIEKMGDGELSKNALEEKFPSSNGNGDANLDSKPCGNDKLVSQNTVSHGLSNVEGGNRAGEVVGDSKSDVKEVDVKEELCTGFPVEQQLPEAVASSVLTVRCDNEMLQRTASEKRVISQNASDVDEEKDCDKDSVNNVSQSERQNFNKEADRSNVEDQGMSCLHSTMDDVSSQNIEVNVENREFPEHQSVISPPQKESPAICSIEPQKKTELRESNLPGGEADETEECASSMAEDSSSSADAPPEPDAKIIFDLNEGFIADDGKYGEPVNFIAPDSTSVNVIDPLLSAVNSVSNGLPASITVAAAAKGPFVPPEELLRSKSELGWKGSATTSAFRPAEPRKALELPLGSTNVSFTDASNSKHVRPLLDIDLNVPDERVLEDMASRDSDLAVNSTSDFINNRGMTLNECIGAAPSRGSVALDLDLNRVDEADEVGNCSSSIKFKVEGTDLPVDSSGGLSTGDVRRDFDLNDGPLVDDASAVPFSHQGKSGMLPQLPTAGLRMNNLELGNFPSRFPPGNTYSTVAIPSMLPDRGDQPFSVFPPGTPQRMFAPTGGTPFTPDVYRGQVLSSSPAIHFPYPFGTTFPLPSATFSVGATSYVDSSSGGRLFNTPINSQFLGHGGAVSSQPPRPYLVSLPDSSSNGGLDSNGKWGRRGLDLNAGPGAVDIEGREEMLPLASRQLSVASSRALTEEQARILSVPGGILKRKEPDGGWDNESFRYKQSSWQ
ncbi:BAH domain [Olea europaea subsp. europaea]|uniref:BAH domain n=1 Tax=Olea europaea subsp. europaea TaxID=158383 RepID=A0A8S0T4W0_OLEEU|nr:BAH domain [Olea europaea subsp. europaea]